MAHLEGGVIASDCAFSGHLGQHALIQMVVLVQTLQPGAKGGPSGLRTVPVAEQRRGLLVLRGWLMLHAVLPLLLLQLPAALPGSRRVCSCAWPLSVLQQKVPRDIIRL